MVACVEENLKQWKTTDGPVDLALKLRDITRDVLCRTAFGTSYTAGKEVFQKKIEQQYIHLEWQDFFQRPPIDAGGRLKESSVSGSYGKDLLGLMLAANEGVLDFNNGKKLEIQVTMQDVIDECKTFFFTSQETSAALLAWTMLLLALNPEWQTRLRHEVREVCGEVSAPNSLEMLGNLKSVKLKELATPKGTLLLLPLIVTNYSEKLWGEDAKSFNPNRFVAQQQRPFLPFSVGPRTCVEQSFAMIETKIILAMILLNFTFEPMNLSAKEKSHFHKP
ncbi:cytokinin hydroxylase-like [Selaginella moellendorffii]|uniref:cytokinin hydroxylase-like n=1 Tax=Selaginella moellendorffii TaxID=88036 RepID=UPI000D1D1116|nr:cytokinin hydroxylase-like [Selaginella moellendorffii]|eukprot:XP_024544504.1 cytokinin hydroxylase-like [Selaginella moellendorffii]